MTITLNPTEIQTLLNNMSKDEGAEANVRYLALIEDPSRIEFADEDGEPFAAETVARIHAAARERTYHCYSCDERKPVSEWSRDSSNLDLCAVCLDEAETENAHSDGHHAESPDPNCAACKSDVRLALDATDETSS